jgi:hypothetical protein
MNLPLVTETPPLSANDGCNPDSAEEISTDQRLLNQMAVTGGFVWSPQTDSESAQALFEMIETAKANAHA